MLRRLLRAASLPWRRKVVQTASQRAARKQLVLGMRDTTALVRRRLG